MSPWPPPYKRRKESCSSACDDVKVAVVAYVKHFFARKPCHLGDSFKERWVRLSHSPLFGCRDPIRRQAKPSQKVGDLNRLVACDANPVPTVSKCSKGRPNVGVEIGLGNDLTLACFLAQLSLLLQIKIRAEVPERFPVIPPRRDD